jgi:hypothetical protein
MCPQASALSYRGLRPLTRQLAEEAMRYHGQMKQVCPKAVTGA